MTIARSILALPAQFQWDPDSKPAQPDNCRPTSAAMIAGYYKDHHYAPTYMRGLMTGDMNSTGGTNAVQMVAALKALDIEAGWAWLTPDQVRAKVANGIPLDIAVLYGKIPEAKRYRTDFGFDGAHSVTACQVAVVDGVRGLLVRDPDHGSAVRPERPDHTFWPDSIWEPAFKALSGPKGVLGCAAYPKEPKPLPPLDPAPYHKVVQATSDLHFREKPWLTRVTLGTFPAGRKLTTTRIRLHGGSYKFGSTTRTDWLEVLTASGKTVWIARAYTRVVGPA